MPESGTCYAYRRVSLVVPIRNEEGTLATLIESIGRQTRAPDEVVLVDGGSADRTVALAPRLIAGDPRFRVIEAGSASRTAAGTSASPRRITSGPT
jgi:glycosyltransferase involved in cell wall biosynthesis